MIAPDTLPYDRDRRPVCWQSPSEFGYFTFGEDNTHFDIIIATTETGRDAAISDGLFSGAGGPCR